MDEWLKFLAFILLIIILGSLPSLWNGADHAGWIPHHQATKVWSPDGKPWEAGEYLDCVASPRPPLTDPKHASSGIEFLSCARTAEWDKEGVSLTEKEMQVTYWGRIAIPYPESAKLYHNDLTVPFDKWRFRWHCRRNSSDVTCWAVN